MKQHVQTHKNSDIRETFQCRYCDKSNKQYYYYSSLRKHIQTYHKAECKNKNSDTGEVLLRSRKLGGVFLVETFDKVALKQLNRHELHHKGSMMYMSHIFNEDGSDLDISQDVSAKTPRLADSILGQDQDEGKEEEVPIKQPVVKACHRKQECCKQEEKRSEQHEQAKAQGQDS